MSASTGSPLTPLAPEGAGYVARPSLCLTCASSIPPKTLVDPASGGVFTTPCCKRVICANCLSKNSRLRAYDPCLACLAGVDATTTSIAGTGGATRTSRNKKAVELLFDANAQADADADGRGGVNSKAGVKSGLEVNGLMESEMFTIGDSDDEEQDEDKKEDGRDRDERLGNIGMAMNGDASDVSGTRLDIPDPPPYSEADQPQTVAPIYHEQLDATTNLAKPTHSSSHEIPSHFQTVQPSDQTKYYIQPKDTLSGISLKLGINVCFVYRSNTLKLFTRAPNSCLEHIAFRVVAWHASTISPQALSQQHRICYTHGDISHYLPMHVSSLPP